MTPLPYPLRLEPEQRAAVENIKNTLNGVPKYSEILRRALTIGLTSLAAMPSDQLAKEIRGF